MTTLPAVPPILDAPRVDWYTIVVTTAAVNVTFPIFGTAEDLDVFIGGVLQAPSTWFLTSASGTALDLLPLPITDGVINFNTAVVAPANIAVVGNWQPRQVIQPTAAGISRREFNQTISTLIASLRELEQSALQFVPTDGVGDGFLSADNNLISNVGDAVLGGDAVNLATLLSVLATGNLSTGVSPPTWEFTGTGAQTSFSLGSAVALLATPACYIVTANGLTLNPGVDYTVNASGQTINFVSAPVNAAVIVVRMMGSPNMSAVASAIAAIIALPTYSGSGPAPVPTGQLFWNNGILTKAQ